MKLKAATADQAAEEIELPVMARAFVAAAGKLERSGELDVDQAFLLSRLFSSVFQQCLDHISE